MSPYLKKSYILWKQPDLLSAKMDCNFILKSVHVSFFFQSYCFTIYKAAILPHLTYCHLTWHFCKASDRRKFERIQERGLRAVFKDKHSCYEKLLAKADIPSLYNRRLQDIAIFMYKIMHNLLPQGLCNRFL